MQHIPWAVVSRCVDLEIVRNFKFNHRAHESRPLHTNMNQLSQIFISHLISSEINSNIILPYTPNFSKMSLLLRFHGQNSVRIHFSMRVTYSSWFILPDSIMNFVVRYSPLAPYISSISYISFSNISKYKLFEKKQLTNKNKRAAYRTHCVTGTSALQTSKVNDKL
jgi:hypothetical protein